MNATGRPPLEGFEQRLLRELREYVKLRADTHPRDQVNESSASPRGLRRHVRHPAALSGLAVAVLAGAVIAVLSLATSATPAFAGWTATPTTPGAGQLASAEARCGPGLGTPVLTDTRGPYTLALYVQGDKTRNTTQVCWNGQRGLAIQDSPLVGSVRADTVQAFGYWSGFDSADMRVIVARVGSGVRSVTLRRTHGAPVAATVSNGWAVAWWPGGARATPVAITTASGTHRQAF